MHSGHHHRHAHLAQRAPEPQNGSPTTRSFITPPAFPTRRPGATESSDDVTTQQARPARPTTTGVLLGDPQINTPDPEPEPSPTPEASPDNGETSFPSPTEDGTDVVATTPANDSPTTFATSAFPTPDSETSSSSSSSSRAGTKTTSSIAGSATTGTSAGASSSSDGMSTGAKVGLAVGIIAIIGVFAVFLLLFMAKKRKQREAKEKVDDEKRAADQAAAASAAASAKQRTSAPNAPRLSLRPVSRLVPDLIGGNRSRNRNSQGNMLTTFSESRGDRSLSPSTNMQQGHPRENPFNDPVNPFNDPEKAGLAGGAAAAYRHPQGHAHELEDTRSMTQSSRPGTANSQFPGAPAPAVATGPGPDQPQGNVYRILLEFKPTMEDELELRAGQHVRLLHEYDDGWALCITLDRSQQGVVPRTCLAAKPSKPRPPPGQGPNGPNGYRGPPGPQGRPITPSGPGGPRMNSPNFRPDSPANRGPDNRPQTSGSGAPRYESSMTQGNFNQAPRPLSPGPRPHKRSESPGPYGAGGPPPMHGAEQRPRSNSASHQNGPGPRNSPPGRSNLGPGGPNGAGFAF